MAMTKQEFLWAVEDLHKEWAKTARVEVDERYSNNDPSQYAEGIEAVSAVAEDDDEYMRQLRELMDRFYTENGKPTIGERLAAAEAKAGEEEDAEEEPSTEPSPTLSLWSDEELGGTAL
jgi:lipopolysaccharide biosynthesis regulator YciM